jgi:hypothetical protein
MKIYAIFNWKYLSVILLPFLLMINVKFVYKDLCNETGILIWI